MMSPLIRGTNIFPPEELTGLDSIDFPPDLTVPFL